MDIIRKNARLIIKRFATYERIGGGQPISGRYHNTDSRGAQLTTEIVARYAITEVSPAGKAGKITLDEPITPELQAAIEAGEMPADGARITTSYSGFQIAAPTRDRRGPRNLDVTITDAPWSPDAFDENGDDRPVITSEYPCLCGAGKDSHHNDGCTIERHVLSARSERQRIRKGIEITYGAEVTIRFKIRQSGINEDAVVSALNALAKDAGDGDLAKLHALIDRADPTLAAPNVLIATYSQRSFGRSSFERIPS